MVTVSKEPWALLQASNTRQACSATLLAFLLDYPLGPKRVEFHFNFLLSNLQVCLALQMVPPSWVMTIIVRVVSIVSLGVCLGWQSPSAAMQMNGNLSAWPSLGPSSCLPLMAACILACVSFAQIRDRFWWTEPKT